MCGEHRRPVPARRNRTGSSPRVRGTQERRARDDRPEGIIPACAGNTNGSRSPTPPDRDHPRVCGEHHPPLASPLDGRGSSPRVRGTPDHAPGPSRIHGIIPACAGNTRRIGGKRHDMAGIIPACAGNTTPARPAPNWTRDHPRVCGEHEDKTEQAWRNLGSSPRVRGTPCAAELVDGSGGIIPACAGNTDHHLGVVPVVQGSSPRVRGTLCRRQSPGICLGIIPACAGNTTHSQLCMP